MAEIFLRSQLDKKLLLDVRNSTKFPPKTPKFPNKTHQLHKVKREILHNHILYILVYISSCCIYLPKDPKVEFVISTNIAKPGITTYFLLYQQPFCETSPWILRPRLDVCPWRFFPQKNKTKTHLLLSQHRGFSMDVPQFAAKDRCLWKGGLSKTRCSKPGGISSAPYYEGILDNLSLTACPTTSLRLADSQAIGQTSKQPNYRTVMLSTKVNQLTILMPNQNDFRHSQLPSSLPSTI